MNYNDITEYRGLKIVRPLIDKPKTNAAYSRTRKCIKLYKRFFTYDEKKQKKILEHEFSHHIFRGLPKSYQRTWKNISTWRSIEFLNITWICEHTENAYITNYAKTKYTEDWAETYEESILGYKKRNNYIDFKVQTVLSMMEHFSNLQK